MSCVREKADIKYKTLVDSPTTRFGVVAVASVVCACASPLWPVCGAGGGKQRWSRAHTPTLLLLRKPSFFFLDLDYLRTWVPFEKGWGGAGGAARLPLR